MSRRHITAWAVATMLMVALTGCSTGPTPEPSVETITDYWAERSALFTTVYDHRVDRRLELSPAEERVAGHLDRLKVAVYAVGGHQWPGQSFFKVKGRMEGTELFRFLQQLPKGGVLHIHSGAMGDLRRLIATATYRPDCYVFRGDPAAGAVEGALALHDSPPGDGWVAVAEERRQAADAAAYDEALYRTLTLGEEDAGREQWPEFATIFARLRGLWKDPQVVHDYLLDAVEQLVTVEHLSYAELRIGSREDLPPILRSVRDEIRRRGHDFELRAIVNVARYAAPGEEAAATAARFGEIMRATAASVRDNPDLVVGFDLVAEEDAGLPASFFAEQLLALRAEGVELPLLLHAGESARQATTAPLPCELTASCERPFNNNLFDALLLGTRRLGHGFALARLPGLMEEYRRQGVCVEVCPISNQVLGYVPDLRQHPAVTLLNGGLPITLSSDDPGIFQYQGVTHDWWAATVAWDLDLRTLKQLALNSLRHGALDETSRERVLAVWQRDWDRFVAEHDPQGGGGEASPTAGAPRR